VVAFQGLGKDAVLVLQPPKNPPDVGRLSLVHAPLEGRHIGQCISGGAIPVQGQRPSAPPEHGYRRAFLSPHGPAVASGFLGANGREVKDVASPSEPTMPLSL
jgi:hypothetical protein